MCFGCDTSNEAEEVFEAFQSAFKVFINQNTASKISPKKGEASIPSEDHEEILYVPREKCASSCCDINGN